MKQMYIGLNNLYWSEIDQYGDYNMVINQVIKYMMDNALLDNKDVRIQGPVERRHVIINNPDYELLIEGEEHNNELSLARMLMTFVEGGYGELECWEHSLTPELKGVQEHDRLLSTIGRNYNDALKCINVIDVLCDDPLIRLHCDRARGALYKIAEVMKWKKTL